MYRPISRRGPAKRRPSPEPVKVEDEDAVADHVVGVMGPERRVRVVFLVDTGQPHRTDQQQASCRPRRVLVEHHDPFIQVVLYGPVFAPKVVE